MIPIGSKNFQTYQADVVEARFIKADTTNSNKTKHYALHTAASTDYPIGLTTADAESDENEPIQSVALEPGKVYGVEAGETIALGEQVAPGADGKAMDHDTQGWVSVGTCIYGGDNGDIILFVVDASFGLLHA